MNTEALIEGTVTGVAAAIVIGIWSESSAKIRDYSLERKVRKSTSNFGIGSGIHGISVTIHNHTDVSINVRGAAISTDDMDFILNPELEIENAWTDLKPKIGDKHSEMKIGTIFRKEERNTYPDIPAHSSRGFRLHPDLLVGTRFFPIGAIAVIEFPLPSGGIKIIRVQATDREIESLRTVTDHMKKEIASGNLDAARKMFGLSPLRKK